MYNKKKKKKKKNYMTIYVCDFPIRIYHLSFDYLFICICWLNLQFVIPDSSPGTSDIVARPSYSLDCSAPGVPGDRILSIESWLVNRDPYHDV